MNLFRTLAIVSLLASLSACTRPDNPNQVRERAADATAAVKRDSKAIAQGIKEGWNRDKPLNLNTATREQLKEIDGINDVRANRIIANRPYNDPHELVSKRVLTQKEYDLIADRLTAKK